MRLPAWTSLENLGVPMSHPRSAKGRGTAAPPGRDSVAVGRGPAPPGHCRARLGAGCPTRPTPVPLRLAGASGSPTFPALVGREPCAPIPGRHAKPGTAAPGSGGGRRGALGLTRSLGVSGASPRPAPGPSGSESGRLP